jgi:tetratricopeptide (TPR) repeat protein
MNAERYYIDKTFYQTFMKTNEQKHPIAVLGEAYLAEQQKDLPDLSFIRFAQAEVYFHHKDYEAAIFKWENIDNDLAGWAQKNTADAFFELGELSTAEEVYKSVNTDSPSLKAEVALQLFSLYLKQERLENADAVIKNAISMNPDYPNMTSIARSFFEENMDWHSAVELAVNEAIRTEELFWFETLKGYIDSDVTRDITPGYFMEALFTLSKIDKYLFEEIVSSLWRSYKETELFDDWIEKVNLLILDVEIKREEHWAKLSPLYHETFEFLVKGDRFIKELSTTIPDLLKAWVKITDSKHAVYASSALLAWVEMYSKSIDSWAVKDAKDMIAKTGEQKNGFEASLGLLDEIVKWTKNHEVSVDSRYHWVINELKDLDVHRILIFGSSEQEIFTLTERAAGENMLSELPTTPVLIKNNNRTVFRKVSEKGIETLENAAEFQEETALLRQPGTVWLQHEQPAPILQEHSLKLLLASNAAGDSVVNMADSILYVIDGEQRLTEQAFQGLVKLKEKNQDLKVNVLLSMKKGKAQERTVGETKALLGKYFPDANVFQAASSDDFSAIARYHFTTPEAGERTEKLLFFIKDILKDLLRQRVDRENNLIDSIQWNRDMEKKLNGARLQLQDLESEKAAAIKESFLEKTAEVRARMVDDIPGLLKNCTDFIKEDSDFRTLHLTLNEEMNRRLEEYLTDTAMPLLKDNLQEWISFSKAEFEKGQYYLEEMRDSFNAMYGEERLHLFCDFTVLNDWRRDADRMTSKVMKEQVNILLRRNPSQVLLKSVGKLFGTIGQNKQLLHNQYTKFIENENYDAVAQAVMQKFMGQFQLFQQSIERDVSIFFRGPLAELEQNSVETRSLIEDSEAELSRLKANPEVVKDPLSLFTIRQRQYELIYKEDKKPVLTSV